MDRITSEDVAKRAGVSRSAVSAVLNETKGIRVSKTKREAILQAVNDMNYKADAQARALKIGRTNCIAAAGHLQSPIFFQMLEGVQQACLQAGYHLLLYGSEQDEAKRMELVDLFSQRRIDGIITQDYTSYGNREWESYIKEKRIPYVSVEGYPEHDGIASVLMDYSGSVKLALDHIWQKTGLPPVYLEVFNGPDYRPNWGDQKRLEAYQEWTAEHGLLQNYAAVPKGSWAERGTWYTEWLARQPRPFAVLTNWSKGAINVYRAAYELDRRIGRDLFVMAADNREQANEYLVPRLTSIEIPYVEMGKAAAFKLFDYIEKTQALSDTNKLVFSPRLLEGESV